MDGSAHRRASVASKKERGRRKSLEKKTKSQQQQTGPTPEQKQETLAWTERLVNMVLLGLFSWAVYYFRTRPQERIVATADSTRKDGNIAKLSVLKVFAKRISWGTSTTPSPITEASILAKAMLRNESSSLPETLARLLTLGDDEAGGGGDYISEGVDQWGLARANEYMSERNLQEIRRICEGGAGARQIEGGEEVAGRGPIERRTAQDAEGGLGGSGGGSAADGIEVYCDINEQDPEFGITPMHLAAFYGHQPTIEYFRGLGANEHALDVVGRAPSNMSYEHFVANSRKWARAAGRECEFPQVVIPTRGKAAEISHALSEVRRLVSEGEPVLISGVMDFLKYSTDHQRPVKLKYGDGQSFVDAWGDRNVTVSGVPYGGKFGVANEVMTLREYVNIYMSSGGGDGSSPGDGSSGGDEGERVDQQTQPPEKDEEEEEPPVANRRRRFWDRRKRQPSAADVEVEGGVEGEVEDPSYVFEHDVVACREGYDLTSAFLRAAFPVHGKTPLICPPGSSTMGLESMHYYLGAERSGAPFHVHSDAINLLIEGEKRWWIVPPRQATFSKQHISAWERQVRQEAEQASSKGKQKDKQGSKAKSKRSNAGGGEQGKGEASSGSRLQPLHCVQRAGDMVYVPFDWGHAAMNTAPRTFGYTMELLNRRDTYMTVTGQTC